MSNTVSEKIKGIAQQSLAKYQGNLGQYYTWEEIAQHNTRTDFWTVVNGYVYDLTAYINLHPGGFNLLFRTGGQNATTDFEAMFHSRNARLILECFCIGRVKQQQQPSNSNHKQQPQLLTPSFKSPLPKPSSSSTTTATTTITTTTTTIKTVQQQLGDNSNNNSTIIPPDTTILITPTPTSTSFTISSSQIYDCNIIDIKTINHDTKRYVLKVPVKNSNEKENWVSPLSHVSIFKDQDLDEYKSYTPVEFNINSLELHLVIKNYSNGNLSKYINDKVIGDIIKLKGPIQTISCSPSSSPTTTTTLSIPKAFNISNYSQPYLFCMVGGTGITPIIQILNYYIDLHNNSKQQSTTTTIIPKIILLYSNKTIQDIIYKSELDNMATILKDVFYPYYIVTNHQQSSTTSTTTATSLGKNIYYNHRIDINIFQQCLENHRDITIDNNQAIICGPNQFNQTLNDLLLKIGYDSNNIYLLE